MLCFTPRRHTSITDHSAQVSGKRGTHSRPSRNADLVLLLWGSWLYQIANWQMFYYKGGPIVKLLGEDVLNGHP